MGRIGESLRTRRRLLIAVTAATLGIICGYDLSNIAGALLFISNDFNLTVRKQELLTTIVVIGEICGALSGGFLANAIGRKRSMMLVAGGYAVFSLLGAAAVSMPWLMAARMLLGMTIGLSATVTPVFIAEVGAGPTARFAAGHLPGGDHSGDHRGLSFRFHAGGFGQLAMDARPGISPGSAGSAAVGLYTRYRAVVPVQESGRRCPPFAAADRTEQRRREGTRRDRRRHARRTGRIDPSRCFACRIFAPRCSSSGSVSSPS